MTKLQMHVYEKLVAYGLPMISVCAIMGNISCESAWKVDAIEKANGIGYGLCQWSFGRREELERFGTDLDSQIEFLYQELSTNQYINKKGYITKKDFLAGNGTIEDLTRGFCFCWERPKEETSNIAKRIQCAKKFYQDVCKNWTEETSYYPKYQGTRISIVDALKSLDIDSSFSNRKQIAKINGIANYTGVYTQNLTLLSLLKKGLLKRV